MRPQGLSVFLHFSELTHDLLSYHGGVGNGELLQRDRASIQREARQSWRCANLHSVWLA